MLKIPDSRGLQIQQILPPGSFDQLFERSYSLYETQRELEAKMFEEGHEKYVKQLIAVNQGKTSPTSLVPAKALLSDITAPVAQAIRAFLEDAKGPATRGIVHKALTEVMKTGFKYPYKDGETMSITLSEYEIAFIACKVCLLMVHSERPKTLAAPCRQICDGLRDQIQYKAFARLMPKYVRALHETQKSNMKEANVTKAFRRAASMKEIPREQFDSSVVIARLGRYLIETVIQYGGGFCQISLNYRPRALGKASSKTQTLEWTEAGKAQQDKFHAWLSAHSPVNKPMVIPPARWTGIDGGGYLTNAATTRDAFVKVPRRFRDQLYQNVPMTQHMNGINLIQETAYRINKPVLEVLKVLWEDGGIVAKLPDRYFEPTKFWTDEEFEWHKLHDVEGWKVHMKQLAYERTEHKKIQGRLTNVSESIRVASEYQDFDEIFYPHNVDWRGRAYALPAWCHPQDEDFGRALIEFAHGKAVTTPEALKWLKIHGANVFGMDKVSQEEQTAWVDDNLAMILGCANSPLGCIEWHDADKPFRFLAWCMDYANHLKDPQGYLSRIPVALDGTCNGLQHFSAMTRDSFGCLNTNLADADRRDIYSIVLKVFKAKILTADYSQYTSPAITEEEIARWAEAWEPWLDRSLCKRPVMTQPYGVTLQGIHEQLYDHIRKAENRDKYRPPIDISRLYLSCRFLAHVIRESIREVVVSSDVVKAWIQSLARVCVEAEVDMEWYTPSGFKCIQRYHKQELKQITTMHQKVRIRIGFKREIEKKPHLREVENGCSPNFVHSLDSAHMILTVLKAHEDHGIKAFAMVHDSYATHAADAEVLGQVIRETFVAMYTDNDILKDFLADIRSIVPPEFHGRLPEDPLAALGEFDLEEVKNSTYFFS